MKILITGAAGFIGYHLTKTLISRGDTIIGIDNFHPLPYGTKLKYDRWNELNNLQKFEGTTKNIETFNYNECDIVCHLAALAGVRASIEEPNEYIKQNITAFGIILEQCKRAKKNLIYASSSSVYGSGNTTPYSENDNTDNSVSLYAATKKSNEILAASYHNMFGLNVTGLRFFTVYGPYGRPDMALFLFANNILREQPIDVYNYGNQYRDFTYIDDIVDGIIKCLDKPSEHEIFNIGRGKPEHLMDFIYEIEKACGKKAIINKMPAQIGDVYTSHACIDKIKKIHNYDPKTSIHEGIPTTIDWFKKYHNL